MEQEETYTLEGIVVHGQQLGRRLGFPTANLGTDSILGKIPPSGVYVAYCSLADGRTLPSMLNIGYRPTVDSPDHALSIEAHILDFDEDIYGQNIRILTINRIRDERKMDSLEDLKNQLSKDLNKVRDQIHQSQSQILPL